VLHTRRAWVQVRVGDLGMFKAAVEKYHAVFAADKTLNLISRLRRNVIRTGLRRINLSYSRISLEDVGAKLGLASGDDAACLVAKVCCGLWLTSPHAVPVSCARLRMITFSCARGCSLVHVLSIQAPLCVSVCQRRPQRVRCICIAAPGHNGATHSPPVKPPTL
jgi:hypothetical protein